MSKIAQIHGREILDSRGFPTVEVDVMLEGGAAATASVPAGASIGTYEAAELRDNDTGRYLGKGVTAAVRNINEKIAAALAGFEIQDQDVLDNALVELDGTLHKKRLGANATLGVSLAAARAAAVSLRLPLWRYLGGLNAHVMPAPLMNIINGGAIADNNLSIQSFLILPHGAPSFAESIRMGSETYHALKKVLQKAHKNTGTGDEGGFSADFRNQEEALDFIVKAIKFAGYEPGKHISIGLDVAATRYAKDGTYHFPGSRYKYSAGELIDIYELLCEKYPIVSIEDGLAEDDWPGWVSLTERLGQRIQLVGDDLFVTHKNRLQLGIEKNVANAIVVKPNQIGTLTEVLGVVDTARRGAYDVIVSHRSGETADDFIADLAVAVGASQLKSGAPQGMARLTKYNHLLRIKESMGGRSIFAGKPGAARH